MFSKPFLDIIVLCADVSDVCFTKFVSSGSAAANVADGAWGGGGVGCDILFGISLLSRSHVMFFASMRAVLR